MSTRSIIAIENADGTVDAIYCHFDGYLSNNGVKLFEHYANEAKVRELIALGDISELGTEIGDKHDFNARYDDPRYAGWTRAYGRDREETGIEAKRYSSVRALLSKETLSSYGAEFVYVYRSGSWRYAARNYNGRTTLKPLTAEVVEREKAVQS